MEFSVSALPLYPKMPQRSSVCFGSLVLIVVCCFDVSIAGRMHASYRRLSEIGLRDTQPLNFTQKLDHFDEQNSHTFVQYYAMNNTNSSAEKWGPIFIEISGEAPLDLAYVNGGETYELAAANGGVLFMLEHRFYGSSIPGGNLSTENMRYLSSEQALADLAEFISFVQSDSHNPPNNKVLIFGCSYAGAMSAWFRLKYPHLVFGSMAGSAPVQAQASFFEYDQTVARVLGANCSNVIRNATTQIEAQLSADPRSVYDMFSCHNTFDPVGLLYVLADTVAYTAQYATANNVSDMCDLFLNSSDLITTYAQYVNNIYNLTETTCDDWDLTLFNSTQPNDQYRQWLYQSCTEFGWFQTAPTNNSLRSVQITVQWHFTNVCQRLFGVLPNEQFFDATNTNYGGKRISTSNTLFTNGGNDPWSTMSITADLSSSVKAIVIDGASHCANFRANRTTDSQAVIAARAAVAQNIYQWLNPVTSSHTKQNKILSYIAVIAGTAVLALALGMLMGYSLGRGRNAAYERIG